MSESPTDTGPCAAYAEEVHEETQTPIPGTKQSAQVRTRKSKRDEASDSGYSSRTAATNGTQSTSSSLKLKKLVGKMTGSQKKSSKETPVTSTKTTQKKVSSKLPKDGLRVDTSVESREDAARIQLSGEPIQRSQSNRSFETSPQIARAVRPSPTLSQHHSNPVGHPTLRRLSMSRPTSYHGGSPSYSIPLQNVSFSSPITITPHGHHAHPPPHPDYQYSPLTYISSAPPAMAQPRQVNYPFQPTLPPQYIAGPGWDSPYSASYMPPPHRPPPQPSMSRRYSIAGPPQEAIVEYPAIPQRQIDPRVIQYTRPPSSYHHHSGYPSHGADEGIYLEDSEAFYKHEDDRRRMPPPQRPAPARHTSTPSGGSKRSNRDSLEYAPRPSSSRKESFSSQQEETRVPLMSRSSGSKNIPVRTVEAPVSPDRPRRSRPQSYHAGVDPAEAAERYQAKAKGIDEPPTLSAYDVKKVNKPTKGHRSKTSDSGSRSGESKNPERSLKKRSDSRQISPTADSLSLEVDEGCTATLQRSSKGYVVRVSPNDENKTRSGRPSERDASRSDRKYSASSRRGSMTEAIARSLAPRRPSSSHPTSRRERIEDTADEKKQRLAERYKVTDDTAVEDDDFSEAEIRKIRSNRHEKHAAQRLQRLKPSSESRQSSRSTRSVRSNKSSKSVSSSKRGPVIAEGQPF